MTDFGRFDRETFVETIGGIKRIGDDLDDLNRLKSHYFEGDYQNDLPLTQVISDLQCRRSIMLRLLCKDISNVFSGINDVNRLELVMNFDVLSVDPADKIKIEESITKQKDYRKTLEFIKHSDDGVFTHQYITRTFDDKFDFSETSDFFGLYQKYPSDTEIRDTVIAELIRTVSNYIVSKYFYIEAFQFESYEFNNISDDDLKLVLELANAVKLMTEQEEEKDE